MFEGCVIGKCPETRRLFASSRDMVLLMCTMQAGRAVRVEKSFFDRGVVHAKVKMFRGVLGAAFRERVVPGKRTGGRYYVQAEARVIHAAFMQARGFFSSSRITAGQNAPDRTNRRPTCLGISPSQTNHGCRTWTLRMHQTNGGYCRRSQRGQQGKVRSRTAPSTLRHTSRTTGLCPLPVHPTF